MKKVIFSLVCACITISAFSQAREQADVSITNVSLSAVKSGRGVSMGDPGTSLNQPGVKVKFPPENLKCTITVFSQNDDDANQTMLVVVLPVEVSIVSNPSNATVYKGSGGTSQFAGYLVFKLGDMGVGQSITVEFTFTKSVYGNKVGAYAYSATPDPNPANNYKDATF